MSTGAVIVLVIVLVLVLAAGAWFATQQMRRNRLRRRFGPEYDHRINESGDRTAAERELTALEKRHAEFKLRTLTDAERARYAEEWTVLQERFVDQPGESVVAAEELVHIVMRDRGYPADDFEQRAADLSVEHASSVGHYRDGHDVRLRHDEAGVSTEELRRALTSYRAIFVSLTGIREDAATPRATRAAANGDANHADHVDRADRADVESRGTAVPADQPIDDQPRHTGIKGREHHA
jgi:hypothetical protein